MNSAAPQTYEIPGMVSQAWCNWWIENYDFAPSFLYFKNTWHGGVVFLAPYAMSQVRPFIEAMTEHPTLQFQTQGEELVDSSKYFGTWSSFSADPRPNTPAIMRARLGIPPAPVFVPKGKIK